MKFFEKSKKTADREKTPEDLEEVSEEIVTNTADVEADNRFKVYQIIQSGNYKIAGYGADEGKFFSGKAHLTEDDRVAVEYFNPNKHIGKEIIADIISMETLLSWQK